MCDDHDGGRDETVASRKLRSEFLEPHADGQEAESGWQAGLVTFCASPYLSAVRSRVVQVIAAFS